MNPTLEQELEAFLKAYHLGDGSHRIKRQDIVRTSAKSAIPNVSESRIAFRAASTKTWIPFSYDRAGLLDDISISNLTLRLDLLANTPSPDEHDMGVLALWLMMANR